MLSSRQLHSIPTRPSTDLGGAMQVVDAGAVEPRARSGEERPRHILGEDEVGASAPADLEGATEHGSLHGERGIGGESEVSPGPYTVSGRNPIEGIVCSSQEIRAVSSLATL